MTFETYRQTKQGLKAAVLAVLLAVPAAAVLPGAAMAAGKITVTGQGMGRSFDFCKRQR